MKSVQKYFLITYCLKKANTCLKTLNENKELLMTSRLGFMLNIGNRRGKLQGKRRVIECLVQDLLIVFRDRKAIP